MKKMKVRDGLLAAATLVAVCITGTALAQRDVDVSQRRTRPTGANANSIPLGKFEGKWEVKPLAGAAGNKVRFSFAGCQACKDIDAPPNDNVAKVLDYLMSEAEVGKLDRDRQLSSIATRSWNIASMVAKSKNETYKDPSSAKTLQAQIDARLAYVCKAVGLPPACQ